MATRDWVDRLLDNELSAAEIGAVLDALRADPQARDRVTVGQLVRDAAAGTRALDDGFTRRILDRWRAQRAAAPGPGPG